MHLILKGFIYAHDLAKVQNWINCQHQPCVRDAQFVVGQGLDQ